MPERSKEEPEWGEALAMLRIACGWTQSRLADAVGIGHSTVSYYESGKGAPLAVLRQMVAAMGCPAYLLDRARALVRWARAARQLYRQPAGDVAAAYVEAMAGAAGAAREELAGRALAAVLGVPGTKGGLGPSPESSAGRGGSAGEAPETAAGETVMGGQAKAARRGRAGREAEARSGAQPLATALRVLRLLSGMERDDLGAAIGKSKQVIESYERGVRRPLATTVERLLEAMELPPEVFDRTMGFLEVMATARRRRVEDGRGSQREQIEALAAWEAVQAEDGARAWMERLQTAAGLLAGRRLAPALWARLARHPAATQRALVREAPEFQDAALCELLCEESVKAAGDSARRAVRLAKLAVLAGERVSGWRQRVEGYARAHLASGLRVGGRLAAADRALARAVALWQAGAGADPGLLNEARVIEIEASLRRDQGEGRQALALLERALAADRWGETPALLLNKAKALEALGDFAGSIAVLRQAAARIDGVREPRNMWVVQHNVAVNLCHLGRHADAALALPGVRALVRRLGNRLDGLRVDWLAAKVAAGLGRSAEAVAGFERVRAGFERHGIAYQAALATVELAEVHAALGRTADVKALARVSAPIFRRQGVHREARRALEIFRRAAEEERVSVELIRGLLAYLERARRDRTLRYRETG
jgi:transcriptional regulator with XRE-family HTH domain